MAIPTGQKLSCSLHDPARVLTVIPLHALCSRLFKRKTFGWGKREAWAFPSLVKPSDLGLHPSARGNFQNIIARGKQVMQGCTQDDPTWVMFFKCMEQGQSFLTHQQPLPARGEAGLAFHCKLPFLLSFQEKC